MAETFKQLQERCEECKDQIRVAAAEIERLTAQVARDNERYQAAMAMAEKYHHNLVAARQTIADIAASQTRDWVDPAEHANWCIERARGGQVAALAHLDGQLKNEAAEARKPCWHCHGATFVEMGNNKYPCPSCRAIAYRLWRLEKLERLVEEMGRKE